jgi:hypothetical protein
MGMGDFQMSGILGSCLYGILTCVCIWRTYATSSGFEITEKLIFHSTLSLGSFFEFLYFTMIGLYAK